VTALFGSTIGSADYRDVNDFGVFEGPLRASRFDVEAIFQIPAVQWGAAGVDWLLGARAVAASSEIFGFEQISRQPFSYLESTRYYLGEIGISSSIDLDRSGRTRLFGAVTLDLESRIRKRSISSPESASRRELAEPSLPSIFTRE